jgi:homogentisate 1,2-dioxygenase
MSHLLYLIPIFSFLLIFAYGAFQKMNFNRWTTQEHAGFNKLSSLDWKEEIVDEMNKDFCQGLLVAKTQDLSLSLHRTRIGVEDSRANETKSARSQSPTDFNLVGVLPIGFAIKNE